MKASNIESMSAAAIQEAAEAGDSAQPPPDKETPRQLSPSVKAFIAQMAENLRTHDPENPRGRLKVQP